MKVEHIRMLFAYSCGTTDMLRNARCISSVVMNEHKKVAPVFHTILRKNPSVPNQPEKQSLTNGCSSNGPKMANNRLRWRMVLRSCRLFIMFGFKA